MRRCVNSQRLCFASSDGQRPRRRCPRKARQCAFHSPNLSDVTRLDILVSGLEELAHIHLEAIELRRMIQDAKATTSWQTISSTPTSVCSYRPDPSSPCHWIRSSGTVRAPLLNIIALINEVDLYKTWIPFLKFAREIGGQGIRCAHYWVFAHSVRVRLQEGRAPVY